jgi:hemerythrin-like domain-containing protein
MSAPTTSQVVLPGQAAAPSGPVDAAGMYLMHFAFRRDLSTFRAAVPRTPLSDRGTWTALAARWRRFAEVLHKHHTGEDAGLWPLLLTRVDAAGDATARATLEAMEAEHAEIDPLLRSCANGFSRLAEHADADARDALEVRVTAIAERLARHLAHEERDAMALVQQYLQPADWERLTKEHFAPEYRLRDVPFAASWVLHGIPDEQFPAIRPTFGGRPMEIIWRLFWRRPFERRERATFRYAQAA